MRSPHHHIEAVMSVVAGGQLPVLDERAESLIHRSWFRCYNDYGLDPSSPFGARTESPASLRYLQVARAGMEELYQHVAELGYVLLIADANGVTLDAIGDPASDSPLAAGLVLGANWNERLAGTNGIGTCLAERRTLTCHREDHYYTGIVGLSCTATPLYDPLGELLGVLDLSAVSSPEARESQHLARHLTALYGRMIEDANFIDHFREHWILRLGTAAGLVDVNAQAMLAFDGDGMIVGANTGARSRLRMLEVSGLGGGDTLIGNNLSAVFRSRPHEIWKLARTPEASSRAALDTWQGDRYYAAVALPRKAAGAVRKPAILVPSSVPTLESLAGDDPRMNTLISQVRRLASRPLNLLIQGETGSGKEVLAKAVHEASDRAEQAFVAVNCAAIPESLIESELFGYMPGTFTGARSRGMTGLIQRASGGTLFLDEIGDMPVDLQTRLLRVLSEGEVLPLGADRPVPLDLHVIAASHRDLRQMIAAGAFREDLYYRLCGATLALPPLRERADLPYLIRTLLDEEADALGCEARIDDAAFQRLLRYRWPGNIRQLRQVLRFLLSVSDDGIRVEHLPPELGEFADAAAPPIRVAPVPQTAYGDAALPHDAAHLLDTLRRRHWNITEAARDLGLCRATIYRRMKRHGIVPPNQLH
ncbi:sigma-54-dependent Fis family transcriptional regulator [Solimonas marina]|uniref:Sigma-54-dependent Fis family transcriptional regulator n=1 Tax=Solimonas marina TaxID=2714601 RepID=A0A970B853_9GAMM|nr:sigma-54-dependent Fis family transcriptional regulator [Solimonas marina]NKF24623.1 sigma-54-dependent Fis family transcriptional regulator [Solimonas marina]